jgi:hypothetical protein
MTVPWVVNALNAGAGGMQHRRRRVLRGRALSQVGQSRNLGQAKVLTAIDPLLVVGSIAESQKLVNRGDDVECEPGARHDDCPAMIVKRSGVPPDFARIEFGDIAAVLD